MSAQTDKSRTAKIGSGAMKVEVIRPNTDSLLTRLAIIRALLLQSTQELGHAKREHDAILLQFLRSKFTAQSAG